MTMERDILEALQVRTRETVAALASPLNALPVKYLGRSFVIPNDQKYLECVHIPNNILGSTWGSEKTYQGLFRLLLHWPRDDAGAYSPVDIVNSIAAVAFIKGSILNQGAAAVHIYENPDYTGSIEAGTQTIYGVSMRYRQFKP